MNSSNSARRKVESIRKGKRSNKLIVECVLIRRCTAVEKRSAPWTDCISTLCTMPG